VQALLEIQVLLTIEINFKGLRPKLRVGLFINN